MPDEPTKRKYTKRRNAEVDVIAKCMTLMDKIEPAMQERVMDALTARYGRKSAGIARAVMRGVRIEGETVSDDAANGPFEAP